MRTRRRGEPLDEYEVTIRAMAELLGVIEQLKSAVCQVKTAAEQRYGHVKDDDASPRHAASRAAP